MMGLFYAFAASIKEKGSELALMNEQMKAYQLEGNEMTDSELVREYKYAVETYKRRKDTDSRLRALGLRKALQERDML